MGKVNKFFTLLLASLLFSGYLFFSLWREVKKEIPRQKAPLVKSITKEKETYNGLQRNIIYGDKKNKVLKGGEWDDFIGGSNTHEYIVGNGGADMIYGERGRDKIEGGKGKDYINGGRDDDTIYGGEDSDLIFGDDGNDILSGDGGDDTIVGGRGDDQLKGGDGDDIYIYRNNDGFDTIEDSSGNDEIYFPDFVKSQLTFEFVSDGMTISYQNSTILKIKGHTATKTVIENFRFKRVRPNIVFVMTDDLGYGHLGCYGSSQIKTPNLDRMASEGMKFTQFYAGAPFCAPSRDVTLTGRHQARITVRDFPLCSPGLLNEDITVAKLLKQAGYRTGIFGKWGIGYEKTSGHPNNQGFDKFFGQLCHNHAHFYYPTMLLENYNKVMYPQNYGPEPWKNPGAVYSQDEVYKKVEEFISEDSNTPFFAYVAFALPHEELLAPKAFVDIYINETWPDGHGPDNKPYVGVQGNYLPFSTQSHKYANQTMSKKVFAAMVSVIDKYMGDLLQHLKNLGIDDNTLVLFTSDNGASAPNPRFFGSQSPFWPFRGFKFSVYEGGMRVPMIARWPGKVPAGRVNDEAVWSAMDILATVMDASGFSYLTPPATDSISFLPSLLGASSSLQRQHKYLFYETRGTESIRYKNFKAVRTSASNLVTKKLEVSTTPRTFELYDLDNDISESNDIWFSTNTSIIYHIDSLFDEALSPFYVDGKEPAPKEKFDYSLLEESVQ